MLARISNPPSLHFHPSDVKKGFGGKKWLYVKELMVYGLAYGPLLFPWRTSPRKRHPPTLRTTEAPQL